MIRRNILSRISNHAVSRNYIWNRIIVILLVSIVIFVIAGCNEKVEDKAEEEIVTMTEEEWRKRRWYADAMNFYGSLGNVRWESVIQGRWEEGFEIVFVHSPEEAANYPDDVSVVWPSELTVSFIPYVNWWIKREGVDLGEFSLEYPLTVESLVDDWEKMNEFWRGFVPSASRDFIWREVVRGTCLSELPDKAQGSQ